MVIPVEENSIHDGGVGLANITVGLLIISECISSNPLIEYALKRVSVSYAAKKLKACTSDLNRRKKITGLPCSFKKISQL